MKLAEALRIVQSAPPNAPPLPVSLVSGFTPLHLETFLRAQLCQLFPGRTPILETGLYDDLIGNLERVAGVTAVVVVIEWSDLDPRLGLRRLGGWEPSQLPDILNEVNRNCDRLSNAITAVARNIPVVASFPTLPLPPISLTSLARASEFTLELHARVASLSVALSRVPGVRIVNSQALDTDLSLRHDVNADLSSGFPYTLPHASALAELLARLVLNPQPKKGLITDLDDTLWRGILGEVGVEGISWDLDHHSQIHALYQQLLHSLAVSGTLIAVASKNDHPLVDQAFAAREPILRATDVFPFEVHWGPKSESITRILQAWNISASDVVCVDDSAMDLAEIQAAHPAVECILFPRDNPQAAYAVLEKLRDLFGKDKISAEDALRASSLRGNVKFQQALNHQTTKQRAATGDAESQPASAVLTDFIRHIDGHLILTSQKHPLDSRALELVNKTNQFNLNGRRFQEAEWQAWLNAPDTVFVSAAYRDKFGPLGKIAVIAGDLRHSVASGKQRLSIRTWVMSCRAFSRFIEHECLRWLFAKLEIEEVEFDFSPSARNTPMQDFLRQMRNAPAEPHCVLSRAKFDKNCPVLTHAIEDLTNEDLTSVELANEESTNEELTNEKSPYG